MVRTSQKTLVEELFVEMGGVGPDIWTAVILYYWFLSHSGQ